jgi:aspartokinase
MSDSARRTNELVREMIERDAVIKNGLARGLINVRALARYFQVATGEEVTFEAFVAGIRRYPVKESAAGYRAVGKMIDKLTLKNNLVDVEILNGPEIPIAIAKFSSEIDYARGETLSIASEARRVRVVTDSKNLDKLTALIPKRSILSVVRNLAQVSVEMSETVIKIPGVLATIATEFSMNGINLVDAITCVPDGSFLVDEKDAAKAYEILERLRESKS